MRVLSALVITHCFGCVVPEDSDDEFAIKTSNLSDMNYKVNEMNLSDGNYTADNIGIRAENAQDACDVMRVKQFWSERRKSGKRYENIPKSYYSEDEQPQGSIDWLLEPQQIANTQKTRLIRNRRRIHHCRYNWEGFHRGFRKSNKKDILNYYENDEDTRSKNIKNDDPREQHPVTRYPHKMKETKLSKEDERFQEDPEGWDDWSNWTQCSVTCGRGRRVRWRHCTTENCPPGFKIAQTKTCRLRDCSRKGFLKWLGIKL